MSRFFMHTGTRPALHRGQRLWRAAAVMAVMAAATLASFSVMPAARAARIGVGISIGVPPPPPRVEVLPPPRAGYVWAPGHWRWIRGEHVWITGHWVVARPGFRWVPAHWRPCGRNWCYMRGHWAR